MYVKDIIRIGLCTDINIVRGFDWLMVFDVTFNSNPVISWRSVLLVEELSVPGENHRLQVTDKVYHIMLHPTHLA